MDSDAGCLLGAVILFVLLWMDFIMTAFASAMRSVSDAELQSAFLELEKPPDEALALKDHFGKMTHTIWLLNTVTYIGSGFLAVQFKRICSPWLLLPILVILFYLIGNSIPEMLGHKHALRWITHRFHIA